MPRTTWGTGRCSVRSWRPTTPGARCPRRTCSPVCAARTCSSPSSRATGGWRCRGPSFAPDIRALLEAGTESLGDAGFSSRSAFLTSSTFGGISWLAHATLHSGLWVDSQQRHDQLLLSDRFTLARGVRAGRLADGRRRAVEPGPLAGGTGVLPLRRGLRPARRRVRGPQVQLRGDPGPVHAGGLRAPGAGTGSCAGDGGDRSGVVARAVDPVAAPARLGRARGRLGLRRHARRRAGARRTCSGTPTGSGPCTRQSIEYSLTA